MFLNVTVSLQPALRECAMVSYFHFIIKILSLFKYHMPRHWLSCIDVNHLNNTLYKWTNLGPFNVCYLTRSFTLSLDINDHNWAFLTYSMEQSPSWEANQFSASQEIPHILWNPKVHYHIHRYPPPGPSISLYHRQLTTQCCMKA